MDDRAFYGGGRVVESLVVRYGEAIDGWPRQLGLSEPDPQYWTALLIVLRRPGTALVRVMDTRNRADRSNTLTQTLNDFSSDAPEPLSRLRHA